MFVSPFVPLPLVMVALPPEATPTDSAVLLRACDRAYLDGDCQPQTREPSRSELVAEIRWINETEASVTIGLRHWRENRWVRRQMRFETHDIPTERYRTLGFALGSLAGTVVEVARLEAEARDEEPGSAETNSRQVEGDSPGSPAAPPRQDPPTPDRVWLGFSAGPGLDRVRLGGTLGIGLTLAQHWAFDLSGSYLQQRQNDQGISAQFAVASLAFGRSFDLTPLELFAQLGPQLSWLAPELESSGDSRTRPTLGGFVGLRLEVSPLPISPFVAVSGGYTSPTDITVDGIKRAEAGPWVFEGSVGVRAALR